MPPRRHGLLAALLALACLHCPDDNKDLLYEPVPLEKHEVKIAADAEGDAKSPAYVSVFLQRGILQMKGGGAHTVEGVAAGAMGDAPPRLELMQDRVALAQAVVGGAPPKGDAKFVLALGSTPMSLEVDTGVGEAQTVDLGGVALRQGRFHTTAGHLTIDWSAPSPLLGAKISLATEAGYVDATHLGKSCAAAVEVKNVAGLVSLDVGTVLAECPPLSITATVTSGKLVLRVPKTVGAVAKIDTPSSEILNKGWSPSPDGAFSIEGDAKAPPRVMAVVTARAGQVELRAD